MVCSRWAKPVKETLAGGPRRATTRSPQPACHGAVIAGPIPAAPAGPAMTALP